ncbi:protein kinase [Trypanosoma conorhini]|uniref:non-specific serine/threonine protein kinase n=1 Tax=Trypanosoma conorhini TaxID=83891 RepID=A0A3R7PXA4_9TRYP|nr:protein kinase [Trypanosoma conorhini]RNF26608.1 protein kinase [Trypanosoma conorhini]
MRQTQPPAGSVSLAAASDSPGGGNKSSTLLEERFPALIGPTVPWKYRQPRLLGRGAWSTVWTLIDNATNETVVGKLSNLALMSEQNKNFARAEAVNILSCDHPNIIRLLESYEQEGSLLHVLEYADGGDLMAQVEVRASRSCRVEYGITFAPRKGVTEAAPLYYKEKEVLIIMAQICLAVKYIHAKKIMHRDIKTSNVLLQKNGLIKLGDFGLSQQYNQSLSSDVEKTFCGTPYYLSPELWRRESYSYKADIWSMGVLFYELMALRKPFISNDMQELMQRVLTEGSYDPLSRERYSQGLCDLCCAMLHVNPHERPNIMEVIETPIMLNGGLEYLKKNLLRLRDIEDAVRSRLLWEVESVQHMCRIGRSLSATRSISAERKETQPSKDDEDGAAAGPGVA